MWRALALALALCLTGGQGALAQEGAQPQILTLNQDRLYQSSLFGQRVRAQLEAQSTELAAENRRIEAALVAEESQLTEDRADMEPSEFRALAEDFDTRVTGIRRAQADKRDALQRIADEERARFFEMAYPVLFELVEESGALAILNQSAVILSSRSIDVTDQAIARINAVIGEGAPQEGQPEEGSEAPSPSEGEEN